MPRLNGSAALPKMVLTTARTAGGAIWGDLAVGTGM